MDQQTPDMQEGKIVIVISSSLYFQSGIRDFTMNIVKKLTPLSEKWAFRFQTIVDELCTNAVEYGSSTDDDIGVSFVLKKGEYLDVIVDDQGHGAKPMTASELLAYVEAKKQEQHMKMGLRGRGLSKIVSNWADELDFADRSNGGIQARARVYFSQENQTTS